MSRRGRLAGRLGVITGSYSHVPGFGGVAGLPVGRFIETPLLEKHEERLCAELIGIHFVRSGRHVW